MTIEWIHEIGPGGIDYAFDYKADKLFLFVGVDDDPRILRPPAMRDSRN